jgi:hypothetical protein
VSTERDKQLEELIDSPLHGRARSLESLDDTDRAEAESLLKVSDLLWEQAHGAPSLEADPVAAMLGLVPDTAYTLDAAELERVMKRSGLTPSSLAKRLSDRGWDVRARDVFNWQTRTTAEVPPALIQAIAEVTGTSVEQLTVNRSPGAASVSPLQALAKRPKFKELAQRWARLQRTSVDLAASALLARLAVSVHRGEQPDEAQMLGSLDALVAALEAGAMHEDEH